MTIIITWVFNWFLWYFGQQNPAIMAQLQANGTPFFTCLQIGDGAPVVSNACIGPPPVLPK